jgi:hypothetical protein
MERGDSPASCCCSLLTFAGTLNLGITLTLIKWDIEALLSLQPRSLVSTKEYNKEIWDIGMSLTVTLAWLLIPLMLAFIACNYRRAANALGVLLLLLGGPNLLAWNILGCVVGTLEYQEFCLTDSNCDDDYVVLAMKIVTWSLLYFIAGISLYGLYSLCKSIVSDRRLARKMKRWRNTKKLEEELLEGTCTICLDNYRVFFM